MPLTLTGLFREVDTNYDTSRGMSSKNPGGGVSVKIENLVRAMPTIRIVTDIADVGNITITEPLWFTASDDFNERVEAYQVYKGLKILWTSDLSFTKWKGEKREAILDATDVVAGNSPYMRDILSIYAEDKVAYLTDPFDIRQVEIQPVREHSIYANSHIIIEKGINDIIDIYTGLQGSGLERIFIGSTDNWGMTINPETSHKLDAELEQVCDKRIRHASRADVMKVASNAWIGMSFARYETFGYSMIEALAGGCHVFCGKHLAYRDRPVNICDSPLDAINKIEDFILEYDTTHINNEGREYVREHYGLSKFREQLIGIIGSEIGI